MSTEPRPVRMSRRIVRMPYAVSWSFTLALCAVVAAAAPPAIAADPAKVLHVALTSAEMSFDPAFSADAGTDGIIDHIFDSVLDYDYLVRPVRSGAAHARRDAGRRGRRRDLRVPVEAGIFFTPDPAFKGKARELTAADQAYSLKRLLDPAVKSPWMWLLEGKVVGADEARAQAIKSGTLRLRRADGRDRSRRSLHAADPPEAARPALSLRVRDSQHRRRRTRGRRSVRHRYRRASGRHRAVHARRTTAAARRSSSVANPGYREFVVRTRGAGAAGVACRSRPRSRAGSCRSSAGSRSRSSRKASPCGSPSPTRELDLLDRLPPSFVDQALAQRQAARPSSRRGVSGTRSCCGRTRAGRTSTWRIRSSAATRPRRSRCAARSAWVTTSTNTSA